MRFASVHASFLRESACLASCAAVGAWVRLYAYAAELERGGRVPVAEHSDRFWNRVAQVSAAEVDEAIAANLCSMSKGVLVVNGYDLKGQRAVEAHRTAGKLGGRKPEKRSDIAVVKPIGSQPAEPRPNPSPLLSSPLLSLPTSPKRSDSPEPPSATSVQPTLPIRFETVGKVHEWFVPVALDEKLRTAYPALDVGAEYARAQAWVLANASNRKTANGMPAFLFRWLDKAQNRSGSRAPAQAESWAVREEREKRRRALDRRFKAAMGEG